MDHSPSSQASSEEYKSVVSHTDRQNLFGEWCVSLTYGRIGQRGHLKQSFWTDASLLLQHLKVILRKRLNAKHRIGCNYEIVGG